MLPVLAMDKARALLAAGLAGDAASELDGAMASFRRQRLDHDLAEARAGPVAGRAGRRRAGRRAPLGGGRRAALPPARQRRLRLPGGAHPAARTVGRTGPPGAHRGRGAAARRAAARLRAGATTRTWPSCSRPGRCSRPAVPDEARRRIAAVRRRGPAAPLDVSLLRRLAQAELAELEGRPGRRWPSSGRAWRMVQARRGRLGSIDLQTGTGGPRRGSGRRRPAAGAGPRGRRRWCSPGWNAPGRRRSGSGRCARPPTRRQRRSWPNCVSSAT